MQCSPIVKADFKTMVQFSLWGNKSDLSLHASLESAHESANGETLQAGSLKQLDALAANVISDCTAELWAKMAQMHRDDGGQVDIILDNAGYELFTDLCLAHWLVASGAAAKVVFHCKTEPWFVSDTTLHDFEWQIQQLEGSEDAELCAVGKVFRAHLEAGCWTTTAHWFWTLPHELCRMAEHAPDLFATLEESDLLLLKGDLNYRKLLADRLW